VIPGAQGMRGRAAKSAELETPCGHGLPRYVKETGAFEDTCVTKTNGINGFPLSRDEASPCVEWQRSCTLSFGDVSGRLVHSENVCDI
jgi:hypothetical protein